MRYIENYELREWIKENLKKTIFQKAHALAVQTGCDILVKLQDASAPTTHQSYATGSIQKAYNNNALKRAPDEKSVSGITGLPLTDQSVQSDISQASISTEELVSSMGGTVGDLLANQTYSGQNETTDFSDQTDNAMAQDVAVPMHISTNSHVSTDTSLNVSQAQQFENDPDDIVDVQIKQEPIEIIDANDDFSEETETKQEQDDEPDFSSHQEQELTGTPLFVQTPVTARSGVTRYPVPMSPKPYQCGVCHKAFRSVHVLQKHTLTFHMKPQIKLAPRRGRGRGSHYLNRPSHQAPQTSTYPVFPGGGTDQTPMTTQQSLQDIPGTSSQQIAHMAQIASSQFPSNSPVAVTPSTSDFSPSSAMFQSPPSGPSTISSPAQQGQGSGRVYMTSFEHHVSGQQAILECLNIQEPVHDDAEVEEGAGDESTTVKQKAVMLKPWPIPFKIPVDKFRNSLVTALAESERKTLPPSEKSNLMEALYNEITRYTYRPTKSHYTEVIVKLLAMYPSLSNRLQGQDAQTYWKNSLSQRFRNERKRSEKHNPLAKAPKIKKKEEAYAAPEKPTAENIWGIKNYLPGRPFGEDDTTIGIHIASLKTEHKKKRQDASLIKQLMDITFADRREAIVKKQWKISKIKSEYPCLFDEDEIMMEFFRATNLNIDIEFNERLQKYSKALVSVPCATELHPTIQEEINQADNEESKKQLMEVGALLILPSLMQENLQHVIFSAQNVEGSLKTAPGAPHIEYDGEVINILKSEVTEFKVVAEGQVVCCVPDFIGAVKRLMAVHYVFNLQYDKKVTSTLTFIQKVLLNMQDDNKNPKKVVSLLYKVNSMLP
ncbi:uncharacterized protein [Amphiura filiformis]|uniref:uncharacterized protein n=1 Tax=Amphiura filiformis TaxID=82378 RepID=UPI003B221EDD